MKMMNETNGYWPEFVFIFVFVLYLFLLMHWTLWIRTFWWMKMTNGTGGYRTYFCQMIWELHLSSHYTWQRLCELFDYVRFVYVHMMHKNGQKQNMIRQWYVPPLFLDIAFSGKAEPQDSTSGSGKNQVILDFTQGFWHFSLYHSFRPIKMPFGSFNWVI